MGMTRRPHAPHRARRAGLDPPSQWQTVAGGGVAGQDPPCDQTSCSSKALSKARVRSRTDRKSVVWGKSVSVRVRTGGRRISKKNRNTNVDRKKYMWSEMRTSKYISEQKT